MATFKKILRILFIIIFVAFLGYTAFLCVIHIDKGYLGLVENQKTAKIDRLLTEGFSFERRAFVPGSVKIHVLNSRGTYENNIILPFPNSEILANDHYCLKVPVFVKYQIAPDVLSLNLNDLYQGNRALDLVLDSRLKSTLAAELVVFLNKNYNENSISLFLQKNKEKIESDLKKAIEKTGLSVQDLELKVEIAVIPSRKDWLQAKMQVQDYDRRKFEILKEKQKFEAQLSRQKIEKSDYYQDLEQISRLLSANPDLLKYIYIDKLGDNIQVIISSDQTGFPVWLDKNKSKNMMEKNRSGDLENFRY